MKFFTLPTRGYTAGKILAAAALLLSVCTMNVSAQLQSPVLVGPGVPPNTIPPGTMPIPPTTGILYTDPVPPQMWLWNTPNPAMPTIRLQNAPMAPTIPPGGSLWGLAQPNNKLSSLACNTGSDPDVVFKADGDTKDLIFTNLGTRSGGIRFATTVAPVGPNPNYTEKERLTITNSGDLIVNPDPGGKLQVNGRINWTGALMPGGNPGTTGQVLTSQGAGLPPVWSNAGGGGAAAVSWLINGNANTTAAHFLGTTGAQPLIVKTDNQERMRITRDGWMGIGTNGDPLRSFEVRGWGQVVGQFSSSVRTTLDILSTANNGAGSSDGNAQIRFVNEFGGGTSTPVLHGSWMAGMDAVDDYKFKIAPLNSSEWYNAATFVIRGDGNVGIGTNNPVHRLSISGGDLSFVDQVHSRSKIRMYSSTTGPQAHCIGTEEFYNTYGPMASWGGENAAVGHRFYNKDNRLVAQIGIGGWSTGAEDQMRTHFHGKVRIGTDDKVLTHTDYQLAVDGKVVAKEYVCKDGVGEWADFVFADDYNLMPLDEVEQKIRENKHLPGIPSAAEVKEQGVNIVEMQTKLLQKIEELTLYMIELKKENRELQQEVSILRQTSSGK